MTTPARGRRWPLVVLALIGVFAAVTVLGCVAAAAVHVATPARTAHPIDTWTAPAPAGPNAGWTGAPSPIPYSPTPDATATAGGPTTSTIPDGGPWLVGKEVQPGTYRATVDADSPNCYWERVSDGTGSLKSILANGDTPPGQNITVTIKATDWGFSSTGCGMWIRLA